MAEASKPRSGSLIGWMAGSITVAPGVDLTDPPDPYWTLDVEAFKSSLADQEPPRGIHEALKALWWAKKGDWSLAHRLVVDCESKECALVHAFLHRQEGDLDNARYWYERAERIPATGDLESEWDAILTDLLEIARELK